MIYEKRVHKYNLCYRQKGADGTILAFCTDLPSNIDPHLPYSLVCGWICGMLRTVQ